METQQLSKAKELLNDNLHNGVLSPRSNEWRKSLFLLGIVFRSEGLAFDRKGRKEGIDSTSPSRQQAAIPFLVSADRAFENAIRRLGELVLRFEKDNKSLMIAEPVEANQARYMIAESYRFRAKLPRAKLRFELIGTVRTTLENQRKLHLNAANAEYENLISRLNRQQDVSTLGDVDNVILRNCYFLAADTLFHLERNEDAIVAYSSATNRYQHEPASLDAYLQIAACYRRLNQPKKAKGIMEQAKVVLTKMPTDLDYTKTSRFSRQQWEQHLK